MIKKTISVFTIFVMILSISITAFAASPKYKSKKAYVQLLEEYDVEYTYQKGELNDEIINFVTDEGEYRKTIDIDAQFVNTEDEMTLYSFGVIEFVPRDYADVLDAVNMLNGTTNYGCFYIAGNSVNASWDVILGNTDAKNIAEIALGAFFDTVDGAYNELSKFEKK